MKKLLLIIGLASLTVSAQDKVVAELATATKSGELMVTISTNQVSLLTLRIAENRLTNNISVLQAQLAELQVRIDKAKALGIKEPTNSFSTRRGGRP